jgi:hypothetical protein
MTFFIAFLMFCFMVGIFGVRFPFKYLSWFLSGVCVAVCIGYYFFNRI